MRLLERKPVEQADASLLEPAAPVERAEAGLRFLMDAGTRLDASLDLTTTLRTLARIVVPRLGDFCMIDMVGPDGSPERVIISHVDPATEERAWRLLRRRPEFYDAAGDIRRTIRSGRTFFNPVITPDHVARAFCDPEQQAVVTGLRLRSIIIVPLIARGHTLGAVTLCLAGDAGPRYTERDITLLEELVRRASLAVDNSRLYTELRRADDAQRFLSEVSRALAASLDWTTTLRTIGRQAVTGFADSSAVEVFGPRGRVDLAVLDHHVPAKRDVVLRIGRDYPKLSEHAYMRDALRTRSGVLYAHITDADLVDMSVDPGHLQLLREFELRSMIWVPMTTRDRRLLGALTFGITESDRRFSQADLALAEEIGRRAAVAVDNARLYTDRSRVAQTLQSSLMPARPPAVAGLDAAARFRPAGDGAELGGDFYDLFEHRPGQWTGIVGDVCGKGAAAAAVTALARHTVRAAARYADGPVGVLHALDRAIREQSEKFMFCTAALVDCRPGPGACAVRVARGGHPPVLVLRADGRVEAVDPPGPLLGVLERVDIGEGDVTLGPGDAVVLYTDGVVEAGAPDAQLGEEWLVSTLGELAGWDADTIAAELIRRVLEVEGGRPGDDIAVLVLRVPAGGSPRAAHLDPPAPR